MRAIGYFLYLILQGGVLHGEQSTTELIFEARFGKPDIADEAEFWLESIDSKSLALSLSTSSHRASHKLFDAKFTQTLIGVSADFPHCKLPLLELLQEIYFQESGPKRHLVFDLILCVISGEDIRKMTPMERGGLSAYSELARCYLKSKAVERMEDEEADSKPKTEAEQSVPPKSDRAGG